MVAQRDPPEWLVDQMLPKVDLAMIYGAPSAGKSFVALDLAFAVSCGFTWFNKSTEPGPVVMALTWPSLCQKKRDWREP